MKTNDFNTHTDKGELFDFQSFISELRDNPKQRKLIRSYEALFGSLEGVDIRQTRFYRNYLSKFDFPFRVNNPKGQEEDWDLLVRLAAASFWCDLKMNINEEWKNNPTGEALVDLTFVVDEDEEHPKTETKLNDVPTSNILNLYKIFTSEQMSLLVIAHADGALDCDVSKLQPVAAESDVFLEAERFLQLLNFKRRNRKIRENIENIRAEKAAAQENEKLQLMLNFKKYN